MHAVGTTPHQGHPSVLRAVDSLVNKHEFHTGKDFERRVSRDSSVKVKEHYLVVC